MPKKISKILGKIQPNFEIQLNPENPWQFEVESTKSQMKYVEKYPALIENEEQEKELKKRRNLNLIWSQSNAPIEDTEPKDFDDGDIIHTAYLLEAKKS